MSEIKKTGYKYLLAFRYSLVYLQLVATLFDLLCSFWMLSLLKIKEKLKKHVECDESNIQTKNWFTK